MQTYPTSLISYSLALLLSFFFASMSDNCKSKKYKLFYYSLSFMVIVLFCGLRFFVGNDYAGYFHGFNSIRTYDLGFFEQKWEPGNYFIVSVFKNSKIGYFFFLFTSTLITYFFIFKALIHNKVLKWGVFFTFTLGLLIMSNDQVRQAIALSIFLFSVKYIEQCNFKKYLIWIVIATLFHYTALALIPLYYIRKVNLSPLIWSLLIILTYIGYLNGVFYDLIFSVIGKIPYYGKMYLARDRFFEIDNSGARLAILFKTLIALFVAIFYNKTNKSIYATLFLLGSIIANISVGFMPIERFSYYLVYTNIIVLPLLLQNKLTKYFTRVVVIVSFVFFMLQSYYALEKHGAVPYRTIIDENISSPKNEYLIK